MAARTKLLWDSHREGPAVAVSSDARLEAEVKHGILGYVSLEAMEASIKAAKAVTGDVWVAGPWMPLPLPGDEGPPEWDFSPEAGFTYSGGR